MTLPPCFRVPAVLPVLVLLGLLGRTAWAEDVPTWEDITALRKAEKLEEAFQAAEARLALARAQGNEEEWARALLVATQCYPGTEAEELRYLRGQPWPTGVLPRTSLKLFIGSKLLTYATLARDEENPIQKRIQEAWHLLDEVWQEREALGAHSVDALSGVLKPNTFPRHIRGTVRDAVTYVWVRMLTDRLQWGPRHEVLLENPDWTLLLEGTPAVDLKDSAVHPVVKLAAVLGDLEAWHLAAGRREAALEARLVRHEALHTLFQVAELRARIREHLARDLEGYRDVPWWAMGQGLLAELEHGAGRWVRAHERTRACAAAYPGSLGAKRCEQLQKIIEAPSLWLRSMEADGALERSLLVSHRNLSRVYFRAYAVDPEGQLSQRELLSPLREGRAMRDRLKRERPVATWSVPLPQASDFREHRTFVVPPMTARGLYLVIASAREDFQEEHNRLLATLLTVTPWVADTRAMDGNRVRVQVLDGKTGRPVQGVPVRVFTGRHGLLERLKGSVRTDAQGEAVVSCGKVRPSEAPHLLVGQGREALYVHPVGCGPAKEEAKPQALVFTDRSVYRPLQQLQWKVVAFREREGSTRFRTLPEQPVVVSLRDGNDREVEKREVRTNGFGSVSGEFLLPAHRLLGEWSVVALVKEEAVGIAEVRVEEYKRPTFEVELEAPEASLGLGHPASLQGRARYFFGLPVTRGSVRWRVLRDPDYPSPWNRGAVEGLTHRERVAQGRAVLEQDGSFRLTFTPKADPRAAAFPGFTWHFHVEVDVTDEGGETSSAQRELQGAPVAVATRVEADRGFFPEGEAPALRLVRTSLEGAPRPGEGRWRLVTLRQPSRTRLPAELPAEPEGVEGEEASVLGTTPGDVLRPRWTELGNCVPTWISARTERISLEELLRLQADGTGLAQGVAVHDAQGLAPVTLPVLPPGAYRFHYETVDAYGGRFTTTHEFLVGGGHVPVALPAVLKVERSRVRVGETVRVLAFSGLPEQTLYLDVYQGLHRIERRVLEGGKPAVLELPITPALRGGFNLELVGVRDYQRLFVQETVFVPHDDKMLHLELSSFRDRLRPGTRETWRVTVKGPQGARMEAGAAELLAYMYDRSLERFAPHRPPGVAGYYPDYSAPWPVGDSSTRSAYAGWLGDFTDREAALNSWRAPAGDRGRFYGWGSESDFLFQVLPMGALTRLENAYLAETTLERRPLVRSPMEGDAWKDGWVMGLQEASREPSGAVPPESPRSRFEEKALWRPRLLTDKDGAVALEFILPDSVTAWSFWVHGLTRDFQGGALQREVRTQKELMVRPYVPRFLREGDHAVLEVSVDNASEAALEGALTLELLNPETGASLLSRFGVAEARQSFRVEAGKGTVLHFPLVVPPDAGPVAVRATAQAGDFRDGELRPLPVLPGRMHLAQSRAVALRGGERRVMDFEDLRRDDDPSRLHEQLVVTVDGQLFHSVLQAMPYLVDYPYECTEQTLNRFVSTAILSRLYGRYPSVKRLAEQQRARHTALATWDATDLNRKMSLEESPWQEEANTRKGWGKVLDPAVVRAEREASLRKLSQAQDRDGGFPWWPGGPSSPGMTLYLLQGLVRASEHGVAVDRDRMNAAWGYLVGHYGREYEPRLKKGEPCCWEFLTVFSYVASSFPERNPTWVLLSAEERTRLLDLGLAHLSEHPPYLRAYLALALKRAGRDAEAMQVLESVMRLARTSEEQGTSWAQEGPGWLWFHDTTETRAFLLRTLMELAPEDPRRHGLVQGLMLDRKLGHWKSTRATAEAVYALVKYLEHEQALESREEVKVRVGSRAETFAFEPDVSGGETRRLVVPGPEVAAEPRGTVEVEKVGKGPAFASATWHFSTERLPEEARGDLFEVSRRYFLRTGETLRPLEEGTVVVPGDEVEVHLSVRAKHAAEYVHLRDPRVAGMEPKTPKSGHRSHAGLFWYEEPRDSGTNFFIEWLPAGEHTFRYGLRASLVGTFRAGPATVQSLYAPEFTAYSKGAVLTVGRP